ncbi:MAG: RNA polymerase sigma factor [Candidatus Firestonebacteria bacterium]|nr:RNA polymerase sigma factor [Candidatus Firestonebacteria bacterium]
MEKNQLNDSSAFKELFDTYNNMVFNVCLRILGSREEAEDAAQEIFFTIYKSLKQFREESKLSTWIYRISVNFCLNLERKKKQAQWLSLDFLLDNKQEDIIKRSNKNPHTILDKSETEQIVQNAVNSLPDNQRIAVILSRYEMLPYQEIAGIMNCSVSSVESYLFRAKQNLYKKLIHIIKEL